MSNSFKISLINVDFDNTYSNVLHFNSRQEQEEYFNVNTLFVNKPSVNLPIGTFYLTRTSINTDMEFTDLMNVNYAIIKDENIGRKFDYWYYFVKNLQYTADKQVICDLELDIFNTYYIDVTFQDCLIRKAHLNRWVEDDEAGYVRFDGNVNSKLFTQEDIKPTAKYLRDRNEFALCGYQDDSMLSYVMYKNFINWIYVYVELNNITGELLNIGYSSNNSWVVDEKYRLNEINNDSTTTAPFIVLCFPLNSGYNNTKARFYVKFTSGSSSITEEISFDMNNWGSYLSEIAPYILNINISSISPFESLDNSNNDFIFSSFIDNEGIENFSITFQNTNYNNKFGCIVGHTKSIGLSNYGYGYLLKTYFNNNHERKITIPYVSFNFSKNYIKNSSHNKIFNPKLLTEQYREFKVGYGTGQPKSYDILKLNEVNNNEVTIKWNSSLNTGIIRCYLGIINSSIYSLKAYRALTGSLIVQDTTMPYTIDQLKQYLAENKNFYLQRDYNIASNIIKSTMNKSFNKVTNSGLDAIQNYINSELTLDNMSNAPNLFKNIDGSPLLNLGLNNNAPYAELWVVLPNEEKIADDYMNMYGYNYNQIDNIKNNDNIRHYFNFVQAELENIFSSRVNISNIIREKFIEAFRKGVRFWNITDLVTEKTYSFTQHENYENWLDD